MMNFWYVELSKVINSYQKIRLLDLDNRLSTNYQLLSKVIFP